ncbi:MAG TPA: nucleotide exchange factor GrpE [Opitutaceae bacterium]|nr:nucleotide exchange factor GrpE [Opitutaceae bacterium]
MSSPDTTDTEDIPSPDGQQPVQADALAAAKKEAADNHDRYLRAVADLENFRRRTVREKDDLRLFAASKLLEDLLPALDNLGLGIAAAKLPNADLKGLVSGVELVQQQMKAVLAQHGLKEINPVGLPFDPHQHEALSHMPSAEVKAEHVSSVIRTGYTLNGRLLRPASVVISSGKAGT